MNINFTFIFSFHSFHLIQDNTVHKREMTDDRKTRKHKHADIALVGPMFVNNTRRIR